MLNRQQRLGRKSESVAADCLRKRGYHILETNYRTRFGEVDLIARDNDAIVFIEVKSRKTRSFGHPKAAVTFGKQKKISMVALHYLRETRQMDRKARFDVVAISLDNELPHIEIIKNAFELAC